MLNTLSALWCKLITVLPLLARRHPVWCEQRDCGHVHSGPSVNGRSRRDHTDGRPELSWQLSAWSHADGSRGPHVSGVLFLHNDMTPTHVVAPLLCSAEAARAFAHDLLRVVALVEAAA